MASTTTQEKAGAGSEAAATAPPAPSPVEDQIRIEMQNIFLDLLGSAQKLSYELATLEAKSSYTSEELKDLLSAAREVVANVKKMHRFLERHAKRR